MIETGRNSIDLNSYVAESFGNWSFGDDVIYQIGAVLTVDPQPPIMVQPHSGIQRGASVAGLRTVTEAFADRAYNADRTLVSRREPGAVRQETEDILEHVLRLVTGGRVRAVDGTMIEVDAQSICLHGDTPGAVAMAAAVRRGLQTAGVRIESFA
ncbi:MAG: LamB/YcsF family protein [Actinomycetota bacterium]|nr:LamB/YcsF family protein [Actinomycetota bacterium]